MNIEDIMKRYEDEIQKNEELMMINKVANDKLIELTNEIDKLKKDHEKMQNVMNDKIKSLNKEINDNIREHQKVITEKNTTIAEYVSKCKQLDNLQKITEENEKMKKQSYVSTVCYTELFHCCLYCLKKLPVEGWSGKDVDDIHKYTRKKLCSTYANMKKDLNNYFKNWIVKDNNDKFLNEMEKYCVNSMLCDNFNIQSYKDAMKDIINYAPYFDFDDKYKKSYKFAYPPGYIIKAGYTIKYTTVEDEKQQS